MSVSRDIRKASQFRNKPLTVAEADRRYGGAGAADWSSITGKPSLFPPSAHVHDQSEVTGLSTALAGKAATSHTHFAAGISDSTAAGRAMLLAADAAAQTALLNAFTSALKGLVPASGGGATNFLRADGTWAAPGGGSDPWSYLSLASDSTVSTTALADVTGMSFTGAANTTYEVEVFGSFQTAATTTGIGLAFNIPSGSVHGMAFAPSATTTAMITMTRADDAALAPTTAVAAANTSYPIFGKYLIEVGATGGTIQLRQRSEIAGSNSVLRAGLRMKHRVI